MQISIKPCIHKTLAQAYGISSKVLHRHLKQFQTQIGNRTGNFYTLMQLLIIIEKIGIPSAWLISKPTNKEFSLA